MRRRRHQYRLVYLIALVIIFLVAGCDTENSIDPDYEDYYVRFFGDQGNQEGVDLIVNESEQTVILLGTTTEPGTSIKRIFLVKSDWEGNLIWKKKLGGPYDVAKDIEFSNTGGLIILSESSNDSQQSQGLGVKLILSSLDGEKLDSTIFKSPQEGNTFPSDYPKTIMPIDDGYIVTGSSEYGTDWADPNRGNDLTDVLHVKFFDDLQIDGDYNFYQHRADNDFGLKTVKVGNDFYTFSSTRKSENLTTNDDYNIECFSSIGNVLLFGTDQSGQDEVVNSICPTFSSGYFLAGTYSNGPSTRDIYIGYTHEVDGKLAKADGEGIIKIPLNTNRMISPTSVCQSKSNQSGYIIVGTEGEDLEHNIWLCKVSEVGGKVLWSSVFGAGDRNDDRAGAVAELPDGKILVVGTVNLGVNNLKMGLFKLNNKGQFAK